VVELDVGASSWWSLTPTTGGRSTRSVGGTRGRRLQGGGQGGVVEVEGAGDDVGVEGDGGGMEGGVGLEIPFYAKVHNTNFSAGYVRANLANASSWPVNFQVNSFAWLAVSKTGTSMIVPFTSRKRVFGPGHKSHLSRFSRQIGTNDRHWSRFVSFGGRSRFISGNRSRFVA
jgi:hypothetical protein